MSRLMKRQGQLHRILAGSGRLSPELQPFGCMQTHSCLRPLQKPASGHPDIGQRKQGDELRRVFLQPAIANLDVAELTLDDSEWMLHLGPHAGLELFGLFCDHTPRRVPLRLALARSHGNVPFTPVASGRLAAPW